MSSFHLPELSYDYDELEPYIDADTLALHYKLVKHGQLGSSK